MAHYIASAVTAGPVTAHHTGVNTQISSYSLAETASASLSIAMCALPPGARITDLWVRRSSFGRDVGSGAHNVRAVVTNSAGTIIGELFGQSVTFASFLRISAGALVSTPALATRLTSSSQLRLIATTGSGTSTTGTAATIIVACVSYLADQRGD